MWDFGPGSTLVPEVGPPDWDGDADDADDSESTRERRLTAGTRWPQKLWDILE